MPDEAEYLTVAQFAGRTGLSRQEVYKLIWAGKSPARISGGARKYRESISPTQSQLPWPVVPARPLPVPVPVTIMTPRQ